LGSDGKALSTQAFRYSLAFSICCAGRCRLMPLRIVAQGIHNLRVPTRGVELPVAAAVSMASEKTAG
jgi:hypothetical protein